jgi:hypothetical protein
MELIAAGCTLVEAKSICGVYRTKSPTPAPTTVAPTVAPTVGPTLLPPIFDKLLPTEIERHNFESALRRYDNGELDSPKMHGVAERQLCFYHLWEMCTNMLNDECMHCAATHPTLLSKCTTADFAFYCYERTKTIGNNDHNLESATCNETLTEQCGDKHAPTSCLCCAQEVQAIPMQKCMFQQVVSFCHKGGAPAKRQRSYDTPLWMQLSFTGLPACRYYLFNTCGGNFDKRSECMVCAKEAISAGVCNPPDVFAFCHAGMPTDYLCGGSTSTGLSIHPYTRDSATYYAMMQPGNGGASGIEWQLDKGFKTPYSSEKIYIRQLAKGWHTLSMFGRTPSIGWGGATWYLKRQKDDTIVAGPLSLLKGQDSQQNFMIYANSARKVRILQRPHLRGKEQKLLVAKSKASKVGPRHSSTTWTLQAR